MVSAKWPLILLALASNALAVNTTPLFPTALKQSTSHQLALTELQEAQKSLVRSQGDPLALKPELMQATQRLELARATLTSQALQVRQQLLADLLNLESLQDQLAVQALSVQVAQLNQQAAQARLKAGAATQLEASRAANELEAAEKEQQDLRQQLQSATERFKKRYGKTPDLSGEETLKWTAQQLQEALKTHPRWLKDHASTENARLQHLIKSSDLSPAVEVEAARIQLENAQQTEQDTLRELEESLEDALKQHQSAQNALATKQKALTLARSNLSTQKTRLDRGLISRLQHLQAELEVQNALLAVSGAQGTVNKAAYGVLLAANLNPWGDGK